MDRKKLIIGVVLVCLAVSALWHWRDVAHGFVDGFIKGFNGTDK